MTAAELSHTFDPMERALAGGLYEIVVGAEPDGDWRVWFEGFEISGEGENTRITASVADQSALHGVLARLRDLGIPLVEVRRVETDSDPA